DSGSVDPPILTSTGLNQRGRCGLGGASVSSPDARSFRLFDATARKIQSPIERPRMLIPGNFTARCSTARVAFACLPIACLLVAGVGLVSEAQAHARLKRAIPAVGGTIGE